jgi:hypothetical protein
MERRTGLFCKDKQNLYVTKLCTAPQNEFSDLKKKKNKLIDFALADGDLLTGIVLQRRAGKEEEI